MHLHSPAKKEKRAREFGIEFGENRMAEAGIGCFVFLSRHSSLRRLAGYRQLEDESPVTQEVRVVVGKEKREFLVDPFVLEKDPFRVLMEMVRIDGEEERKRKDVIFVDVDAILFEHLLWLVYNDSSSSSSCSSSCSFFQLNMKEIIEFYAQDF